MARPGDAVDADIYAGETMFAFNFARTGITHGRACSRNEQRGDNLYLRTREAGKKADKEFGAPERRNRRKMGKQPKTGKIRRGGAVSLVRCDWAIC
jgi:hypothetical protein